jgi:hypothetical protein
MGRLLRLVVLALSLVAISACATVGGGLIGAGIGSFSGDAGKGALIGAGAGAVVDIVDD